MFNSLTLLIYPYIVPLCFTVAWGMIAIVTISLYRTINNGVKEINYLHSIPCSGCKFFTNNYRLKCTVHPEIANSVTAIDCPDYCPKPLFD